MKTVLLTLLVLWVCVLPSVAEDVPTVAAQVDTVGSLKQYVYTLTNHFYQPVYTFGVFMPEPAARAVVTFTCSKANWYDGHSFRGEKSMWAMAAYSGAEVMPGETVVYTLTTPSDVATGFDYKPSSYASNWKWSAPIGTYFGTPDLPVPVPEPCSLLALCAGLVSAGAMRGRKRR